MKINPLVSVIIPTKNSEGTVSNCLKTIVNQGYKNLEIIVVDNNSTDNTKTIARNYTKLVFNKGPERSTQRNFGAAIAKGEYLLFIDSDMELSKNVVRDCVSRAGKEKIGGIIVPEESIGVGFWAKCKALERSFYIGVDWIEAARFFPKRIFDEFGGYDEKLISGEDWDLNQRVKAKYNVARINSFIYHNEGKLTLISLLEKKYYYAGQIKKYSGKNINKKEFSVQFSLIERYRLFFSNPKILFKNPIIGLGMLLMKTSEFTISGIGYFIKK